MDTGLDDRRHVLLLIAVSLLAVLAGCSVLASPSADVGFEEVTNESGLAYTDVQGDSAGGGNPGVYAVDYDRDGWQDVLTVGGENPALWHNVEGEFDRSGEIPTIEGTVKSAAVVDVDGDGWRDVLLLRQYDTPVVLHNDGGTFSRTTVGIGNLTYPLGAVPNDYDRDGDADLFVYQSGDWARTSPNGFFSLYGTVHDDNGNRNSLYENVGGEYRRVADAGISGTRWSLAASVVDLTGDGLPDVHVANDYNNDVLYVNQGDGTFEVRFLPNVTARNGMSSEVSDVDGDGRQDVFTTNIELPLSPTTIGQERYERLEDLYQFEIHSSRTRGNTLLLNRGNGTFESAAPQYGVRVGGWGWSANFVDLNNDGQRDLIHATENIVRVYPDDPIYTYPMVWERQGENFTRIDGSSIGLHQDNGRGILTIDYDHDGVVEYISANFGERFSVYDSTVPASTNSLQVTVVDAEGRPVYGAAVEVDAGQASETLVQTAQSDFLSQGLPRHHIGLGAETSATLHVTWPDGTQRTFTDVPEGQFVRVTPDGLETVYEFED